MYAFDQEWGDERVMFYKGILEETPFTKNVFARHMKVLREQELVMYVRGLISEDGGGYYGSGHMITNKGKDAIRPYLPPVEFQGFDALVPIVDNGTMHVTIPTPVRTGFVIVGGNIA